MKLLADDDIYRARLVYLGPPGYTLPVQATYAQIGVFVALATAIIAAGWLIFHTWMTFIPSVSLAAVLTAYIWKFVDPDVSAFKVLKVAATDWRRITPAGATKQQLPRLTGSHITYRRTITTPAGGRR